MMDIMSLDPCIKVMFVTYKKLILMLNNLEINF